MNAANAQPLPVSKKECLARGWNEIDIILVSGDAYVDHPSFGIALIGRLLEREGYRVAVLAQPRFDTETDFQRFGRPLLFFGISAGNLDSIVANYSSNGKVRDFDAYSPNGQPWRSKIQNRQNRFRPDRAVLHYANLARKAYPQTTIILGGIEASLRRFVHFDYKQNKLRGSHLSDAKADLLVYGMGEKAILEVARRLNSEKSLEDIAGTCIRKNDTDIERFKTSAKGENRTIRQLPGWDDIGNDISEFMQAERVIDRCSRSRADIILLQKQQASWIIQYPPAPVFSEKELDQLYELPFSRKPHPSAQDIPAYKMIKNSVTVVRGCYGNCSFCAITRHQGPRITSRSLDSVIDEVRRIARQNDFDGTITDLGGPTANLYGTECAIGSCAKHDCLFPKICKNLILNESLSIELLNRVSQLDGIKHLFISSGLRLELLQKTPKLLEKLVKHHTPGNLKIAPEHTEDEVLKLMHKEPHSQLFQFVSLFRSITKRLGKRVGLTPYIISAHPGCNVQHTKNMVRKMKELGLTVKQFQDFTPTPGTLSTAMHVSSTHRDKNVEIEVARNQAERIRQRKIIENEFIKTTHRKDSTRRKKIIRK
jgi:uncharacterized radical SAM protein YgiQ